MTRYSSNPPPENRDLTGDFNVAADAKNGPVDRASLDPPLELGKEEERSNFAQTFDDSQSGRNASDIEPEVLDPLSEGFAAAQSAESENWQQELDSKINFLDPDRDEPQADNVGPMAEWDPGVAPISADFEKADMPSGTTQPIAPENLERPEAEDDAAPELTPEGEMRAQGESFADQTEGQNYNQMNQAHLNAQIHEMNLELADEPQLGTVMENNSSGYEDNDYSYSAEKLSYEYDIGYDYDVSYGGVDYSADIGGDISDGGDGRE